MRADIDADEMAGRQRGVRSLADTFPRVLVIRPDGGPFAQPALDSRQRECEQRNARQRENVDHPVFPVVKSHLTPARASRERP